MVVINIFGRAIEKVECDRSLSHDLSHDQAIVAQQYNMTKRVICDRKSKKRGEMVISEREIYSHKNKKKILKKVSQNYIYIYIYIIYIIYTNNLHPQKCAIDCAIDRVQNLSIYRTSIRPSMQNFAYFALLCIIYAKLCIVGKMFPIGRLYA